MSTERKKIDKKPSLKLESKKRFETTPSKGVESPKQDLVKKIIPLLEEKVKRTENKYVRLALDAKKEERIEFSEKVYKGELKLAYYASDNDKGYHYYLVIKK